jgi:hypothetical protein
MKKRLAMCLFWLKVYHFVFHVVINIQNYQSQIRLEIKKAETCVGV